MKFENTRSSGRRHPFRHRAAYYTSSDHLLALLVPLAREAMRANQPVALISSGNTERRLRTALGQDAAGLTHIAPPDPLARCSGQTVVTERARYLRELVDWAGPVTVIAEHHPHRPGIDRTAWIEADAAVNIALASLPITMICLYPTELEVDTVNAAVRWNHPELLDGDGTPRTNPDVRTPAEVLVMHPVPRPKPLGTPDRTLVFTAWQLIEVRTAVADASATLGIKTEKAEDYVLAVNEVASNAVEHGSGVGELHLWQLPDRLVCEVHDKGTLREPLPGLRPPHPSAPRGRGIWIARQLCDLLHVWTDSFGTHARLELTVH